MDETVLKMAAAGLLHDMGKFADREVLDVTETYFDNHAGLYLPSWNGRYTHYHALYTAAFLERYENMLPEEFNAHQWGEGDALINLAAGHHNPQTPMQWIVAVADRVSSGWDRDRARDAEDAAPGGQNFRSVRMVPVFEQLGLPPEGKFGSVQDFRYSYPMEPLTPESMFPRDAAKVIPGSRDAAKAAYKDLFLQFAEHLQKLAHRKTPSLWLEHFESLLLRYAGSIPSDRSGAVIPDVSLYDHSKTTAAICTALYAYHADTGSMEEGAVRDYERKKFLIVSGDFRGIQDFIFEGGGVLAKYRSKILRGRSLSVSLISELAADLLCRSAGLPVLSIVLQAAGKFMILAPNTEKARQAMKGAREKINDWMFRVSFGRNMMAFSEVEASCADFVERRFPDLWKRVFREMAESKFHDFDLARYGGPIQGYLERFDQDPPLCGFCGVRPASGAARAGRQEESENASCAICRDQVFLGTNVVKMPGLVVLKAEGETEQREDALLEPIFGEYQVRFTRREPGDDSPARGGPQVLREWALSADGSRLLESRVAVKPLAGYVTRYGADDNQDGRFFHGNRDEGKTPEVPDRIQEGDPKSLHHIAAMALTSKHGGKGYQGMAALGVLKADVDNLGLLMACGLPENRFTISRLATLSRQLDGFFTMYLPNLFLSEEAYRDVYTVFAGGDDLFLLGPWNRVADLAIRINEEFKRYVCGNSAVTLSAGIALHKPHTPVDAMAQNAKGALNASKIASHEGRRHAMIMPNGRENAAGESGGGKEGCLTVFGETATWTEAEVLKEVRGTMERWLDEGWLSRVMFYRLNTLIRMAAEEKTLKGPVPLSAMACTKWRSFLSYAVERNVASTLQKEERKRLVKEVREVRERLALWLETYGGKLRIPVWSILYDRR